MRLKMLLLVPLLAAMGSGVTTDRPPPPPVSLPQRTLPVPQAIPADTVPPFAALRVLSAEDVRPDEFLWQARPIVVFANTTADLSFVRQLSALQANAGPLIDRDVVVITDADPAANSVWRRRLRPEGFSLVLMDKDGQVKQRKPAPWSVREISRAIDKFPLRLQEIGRAGLR